MDNINDSPAGQIALVQPSQSTSKKPREEPGPFRQYVTPYISSKLKEIASKIRSSANRRFRMRQAEGEMKLVFWSEIKQVSDSTLTDSLPNSTRKGFIADEIDQLVKNQRAGMLKMEGSNTRKRKKVQELIKDVLNLRSKNKVLKMQLKSLKQANNSNKRINSYGLFLMQNYTNQQVTITKINARIALAQEERSSIIKFISQIPAMDNLISRKTLKYEFISTQLRLYTQQLQRLMEECAPKAMLNCMFQVGILNQQIYIHNLQRKENLNLKQWQKIVNKSNEISQNLVKREIRIECHNSSIVEFNTLTAIYMHCKSLTIANIGPLMNSLSFFDVEFKQIYNYSLFERYLRSLIQYRCMDQANKAAFEYNQTQTIKKRLFIIVKKENQSFLRQVLKVFQRQGNHHQIWLNTTKMAIEVAAEGDQPCKMDLLGSQHNELRLYFDNLP